MEKKAIDFEKELKTLDEIVDKISSKSLSLDEGLKLYEKGVEIIHTLEEALKDAEDKIEKVVSIK